MDHLVGDPLGSSDVRRPATSRSPTASRRHRPLANTAPSGPAISTASSASKPPLTPVTPAGSSETPRSSRARLAPSSTTMMPIEPTAKAIHSLRAGSRRLRGTTTVPTPVPPDTASTSTFSRSAWAITARTPDHAAILAAASLEAMPPLPRSLPTPPAMRSRVWSTSTISSMSDAWESERGSPVSRPGWSVSRTSRSALIRWATSAAMRSLSPKRISSSAMASFSLTTGTTPSSSRRVRVERACRYCWRTMKSSGASSTWPPMSPPSASARS